MLQSEEEKLRKSLKYTEKKVTDFSQEEVERYLKQIADKEKQIEELRERLMHATEINMECGPQSISKSTDDVAGCSKANVKQVPKSATMGIGAAAKCEKSDAVCGNNRREKSDPSKRRSSNKFYGHCFRCRRYGHRAAECMEEIRFRKVSRRSENRRNNSGLYNEERTFRNQKSGGAVYQSRKSEK